jgi:NAD-dependent deacetylase
MAESNLFSKSFLQKLRGARSVAVLTGAGVSAESGVPTFRGHDGLWKRFRPEELATVEAFMENPQRVWEWYQHRLEIMSTVEPNPGHVALRDLEDLFEVLTVITQNIDGLHQRAGSRHVIELHGNIRRNRCSTCGHRHDQIDLAEKPTVPICHCGGAIRPDVVWFGESLPQQAIEEAYLVSAGSEVFLSVGTSALVYPAASLPIVALQQGAYVVEINVEPTELTPRVHQFIRGRSGEVLPRLVKSLVA